jgi:glucose 1-dehydrogenase
MKNQKNGRIINTASIHAKRPTGFDVIYSMTKGGIKMLTREAALALACYGITVNTISPGAVDVGTKSSKLPITKNLTVQGLDFKNKPASGYLTGNIGQMRDIGYIAVFLADDRSAYITGSSFRSDGGSMMI